MKLSSPTHLDFQAAAGLGGARPVLCGPPRRQLRTSTNKSIGTPATLNNKPSARALRLYAAASSEPTTKRPIGNPIQLPSSTKDQVDQAFNSVKSAWEAGVKRQCVELNLPLVGATDLDDW